MHPDSAAWRSGELSRATTILTQLSDTRGGELAAAELSVKRAVISDYAKLQQARNAPDFGDRVVRFYGRLDPVEDIHFTSALEQEFKQHSADSQRRADEAWRGEALQEIDYRRPPLRIDFAYLWGDGIPERSSGNRFAISVGPSFFY